MKKIKLVKNRSDIGAGTRGSDMGVDAIEIAAINSNNDYFTRFDSEDVETHNETVYNKVKAVFAKRIGFVLEQCRRVAKSVRKALDDNYFVIVLSGDHSSALGTISGVKAHKASKRLGVVWIDAHADLHSPFTTPSGNVHGMPLAACLAEDNLENQINEVGDETLSIWNKCKSIETPEVKLLPEDLVFFGVRDTEFAEEEVMRRKNIRNIKVEEYRYRGHGICIQAALDRLKHCDQIYISFDVDSLDCDLVSRGTGTPVPKGFDPEEVKSIIKSLMDTGKVVCLELTEVNPLLDTKGNKMAETAFEVLNEVTDYHKKVHS